jgi:hypothetical protein
VEEGLDGVGIGSDEDIAISHGDFTVLLVEEERKFGGKAALEGLFPCVLVMPVFFVVPKFPHGEELLPDYGDHLRHPEDSSSISKK